MSSDPTPPGRMARRTIGDCHLILGPMFSGKTSTLIQKVDRARLAGDRCVVVKWAGDTRYDRTGEETPTLRTHGQVAATSEPATSELARLAVVAAAKLGDVPPEALPPSVAMVAVDEGQFYPDLEAVVDLWVRRGLRVVVSALSGDYLRRPFPRVSALVPRANKITLLSAVCMLCPGPRKNDAPYTLRTHRCAEVELVGGKDKYRSACLACYAANQREPPP